MSWERKPNRHWHYRVPGAAKMACGAVVTRDVQVRQAVPPVGTIICKGCERLYLHADAGALGYKGKAVGKHAARHGAGPRQ